MFKNCKSHKNETVEHFIIKTILWKILLEKNRNAFLEFDSGVGVFDVFDKTKAVVYEVEPSMRRKEMKWSQYKDCALVEDLVMLPYKQIMKKVGVDSNLLKKLKKEIEEYVS